jgi:hypothetical protein
VLMASTLTAAASPCQIFGGTNEVDQLMP